MTYQYNIWPNVRIGKAATTPAGSIVKTLAHQQASNLSLFVHHGEYFATIDLNQRDFVAKVVEARENIAIISSHLVVCPRLDAGRPFHGLYHNAETGLLLIGQDMQAICFGYDQGNQKSFLDLNTGKLLDQHAHNDSRGIAFPNWTIFARSEGGPMDLISIASR